MEFFSSVFKLSVTMATAYIISLTSCQRVQPDQSQPPAGDRTGGPHAETLTSRKAMAAVVPVAVEAVAAAVGCSCGDGEGGTMDTAGPF